MNQTLRDIEIICIDDGSTDDSPAILAEYAKQDTRFTVISLGVNHGAASARNAGLAVAKGEFVGFVDSDDYTDECYFEKLYKAAVGNGADIAKCSYYHSDDAGKMYEIQYNADIAESKYNFSANFTTAIYRKSIISSHNILFPDGIENYEDIVFVIKAVFFSKSIQTINDTYYYYIERKNSASRRSDVLKKLEMVIIACKEIVRFINNNNLDTDYYNKIFNQIIYSLFSIIDHIKKIPEETSKEVIAIIDQYKYIKKYTCTNSLNISKFRTYTNMLERMHRGYHMPSFPREDSIRSINKLYALGKAFTVCFYLNFISSNDMERRLTALITGLSSRGVNVFVLCHSMTEVNESSLSSLANKNVTVLTLGQNEYLSAGATIVKNKNSSLHSMKSLSLPRMNVLLLIGALFSIKPEIVHCYSERCNCVGGYAGLESAVPGVVLSLQGVAPATNDPDYAEWAYPIYKFLISHTNVSLEAYTEQDAESYTKWLSVTTSSVYINSHEFIEDKFIEDTMNQYSILLNYMKINI